MAEPSQSVIINIPTGFSAAQRDSIGREIVRLIVRRTRKGLNINNRPFAKYSQVYKDDIDFKIGGKTSRVNLTLTGEMLNTLEVVTVGSDFVTIGFSDTDGNDKASFNRQNGRNFMGISKKDLDSILSAFSRQTPEELETQSLSPDFASSFLQGILGNE